MSLARTSRKRDGGLWGVNALTLTHGDDGDDNNGGGGGGGGYKVACNLFRTGEVGLSAKDVLERLR